MPAYIVSRVNIFNMEEMLSYQRDVVPVVQAYGGRYLIRSSEVEALEGTWEHQRLVIIEFPTREAALAWYHSPEYAPLKAHRHAASQAVLLLASPPP